jgi:myo-inositol 2-dehydrogenase/D-chiro-inositol 1-dehydrogenase
MSSNKRASRRDFLRTSSALTAGASLVGGLSIARSGHAAGDEELKACLIGCGGRGQGAIRDFLGTAEKLKVVAVADAFEGNAKGAAAGLRKDDEFKSKVDIAEDRVFWGLDAYQKAIAAGVDVVVLAAPPGFRPIHYKAAVEAGKHVFMEKPCCIDAPGYRSLLETNKLADEKGLKVGVGLQRRHEARYVETIKKIHDGALGKLLYQRAYWNGGGVWVRRREPGQTEMQYQVNNWYYFVWLSGDHICEQHIHNLDVANWVFDKAHDPRSAHPVEANGMGGRQVRKGKDVGQIYDHHAVEFTYADGSKVFSQCRHIPDTWSPVSEYAVGAVGESNCAGHISGENKWDFSGPNPGPYQQEHKDLVRAIRNGEKYNEGWLGASSSFTSVLGRMATYSGQIVKWDEAVEKGPDEMPKAFTWDAETPIKPGPDGSYEHAVAVPGIYKPY